MTRSSRDQEPPESEPQSRGWQNKLDKLQSYGRYSADEDLAVEPVRTDPGKRLVALIIDTGVGYGLGIVASFIPVLKELLGNHLVLILFLVSRDALFQGRGVGKNLMGLRVVDLKTGKGIDLVASIKRNIVVFGPTLLTTVVFSILRLLPTGLIDQYVPGISSLLNQSAQNAISLVATLYTVVVLPYEIYRATARDDGMRWGDQFAGTTIVESNMDFSKII